MKRAVRWSVLFLLITLTFSAAEAQENAGTEAARTKALQDGWPDTPAGLMACAWIEAFSTGEEAMRTFLADNLTKEALAERSMKQRLTSYRRLHDQYGSLMLSSVVESSATELTAKILAEDTSENRFVFEVEEQAPHKLVAVMIMQFRH